MSTHSWCRGDFSSRALAQSCAWAENVQQNIASTASAIFFIRTEYTPGEKISVLRALDLTLLLRLDCIADHHDLVQGIEPERGSQRQCAGRDQPTDQSKECLADHRLPVAVPIGQVFLPTVPPAQGQEIVPRNFLHRLHRRLHPML